MPSRKLKGYLTTVLLVALAIPSLSSHLRAVEIRVKRENCASLTVQIIITAYLNSHSGVAFGGDEDFLSFGDGKRHLVPETASEIIDEQLSVARVQYITTYTYMKPGLYTVSYSESNRNSGIVNFAESGTTIFYTETAILLEPGLCNSSPSLLVPPVDRACTGVKFFHNPGARDPDGDSLSYELVVPQKDAGVSVSEYALPDDAKFYSAIGISFNEGNEEKNGPPELAIAQDGMITWDAPGGPGEYGIAIKVTEWKFNAMDSSWYEAGYVIRDMQIIVETCDNQKPELDVPQDLCVVAGTLIQFDIPATDPDKHDVVIEAFSDVFSLSGHPASLQPSGGVVQSTNPPHDTASVRFLWQTACEHVMDQPHQIVFKISDRPPSGQRLVQFYTVRISIIAPAPEYKDISINPVTKTVALQWKDYSCKNVVSFQVWRRVSEFAYEQPECDSGMPRFLRYQLMAVLPATEFSYIDQDLVIGAQYCYRIVALIGGTKLPSRISIDTCFIPKPAKAPMITNVTVQTTDSLNGEMLIRWTRPFDIDAAQYPPPYQYKVFRKIEADTESPFQTITSQAIGDTIFTDSQLNTAENIYRYAIELYVPSLTSSPVDTSSEASSVFVESQPIINGIQINWRANTPWSNYAGLRPYHLIYRSDFPSGPFDLIDSVNVNENDFHYIDRGLYKDLGLTNRLYFYKVKTRGTYGNPKVVSPLENVSQATGGQILDTIPPCAPIPEIIEVDCAEFPCSGSEYYTTLVWQTAAGLCDDVTSYEVLVQEEGSDVYSSLGILAGNKFVHTNLSSLNKCYRLISIDQAGNRSDTSTVVCNSNCLSFKLPNVITPEVADEQNDFLTTYPANESSTPDCSRSVQQVNLQVYSRWGEEIFTTSVTGEPSPVLWNGRTNSGREVPSGVYFYHARVIFDTNDPAVRNQQFKGWVMVIR